MVAIEVLRSRRRSAIVVVVARVLVVAAVVVGRRTRSGSMSIEIVGVRRERRWRRSSRIQVVHEIDFFATIVLVVVVVVLTRIEWTSLAHQIIGSGRIVSKLFLGQLVVAIGRSRAIAGLVVGSKVHSIS